MSERVPTIDFGDDVDASLLDLVDHLLDKGCVLTGKVVLGLADVDLVHVELALLVCAAERMLEEGG